MTTTAPSPLNLAKLYPSFAHFKRDIYKCETVDDLNCHVTNLQKARISSIVHALTEEETRRAWGLIRWKGKQFAGAYELSDHTWRVSRT